VNFIRLLILTNTTMPITESQPFAGSIHEIRKTILDNKYFGKQAVILYFGNIERDTPEICEWHAQPPEKIDKYEKAFITIIKENFQEYQAIIGAVPPHAGSLFVFGSPVAGHSEVNPYKLATIDVESMTVKKEKPKFPVLFGCSLDLKIMNYELDRWCSAETLEEYYNAHRNATDITIRVKNPNKASKTAQEFIAQLYKR